MEPFWLDAAEAPAGTSRTLDVAAGDGGEEIELREPGANAESEPAGATEGESTFEKASADAKAWIRQVEADYPSGTAGMGPEELRELAESAQEMVGTASAGLDPRVPVKWRFVLSSDKESALDEIARRAKSLGFEVHASGRLTDLNATFDLPPALRARNTEDAPLLGLELRWTEPPTAEMLFQHELALHRLMHETGSVRWRLTGRILPTNRRDP